MAQFRALYMAALAVIITGISGVVIVPRAHAHLTEQAVLSDVRVEAGKYVLNATRTQIRGQLDQIFTRSSRTSHVSW
jgi:hypothetical protein